MENHIKTVVDVEPALAQEMLRIVDLTKEILFKLAFVLKKILNLVKDRFPVALSSLPKEVWISGFIGFVFGGYFKESTEEHAKFARGMFHGLTKLLDRIEYDPPSPVLDAGTVLHKRVLVTTSAGLTREAMTVNSDIKALGTSHRNSQVRLFKKTILADSFEYVGMGMRFDEETLLAPKHVMVELADAVFVMKGSNRATVKLLYDPKSVVKSSDIDVDDFVLYKVGKGVFASTATAKIKPRDLVMNKRVYVYACHEGQEQGTVSEGIPSHTSMNFQFSANYSTVPGHSGGQVLQLENGALHEVGMHLHAINKTGDVRNVFITFAALQDWSKKLEANNSSVSSSSSGDSAIDHFERQKAKIASDEFRKQARARGDHRFDDGEIESEWEETNAQEVVRMYKENEKDFLENYAYSKRGWVRRGGKGKGGVKIHESTKTEAELLKVQQRGAASLTQKNSKEDESVKTSSQTATSQDSSLVDSKTKSEEKKSTLPSKSSESQTQLQDPDLNVEASISTFLQQKLDSGKVTKTKLLKAVTGLKAGKKE